MALRGAIHQPKFTARRWASRLRIRSSATCFHGFLRGDLQFLAFCVQTCFLWRGRLFSFLTLCECLFFGVVEAQRPAGHLQAAAAKVRNWAESLFTTLAFWALHLSGLSRPTVCLFARFPVGDICCSGHCRCFGALCKASTWRGTILALGAPPILVYFSGWIRMSTGGTIWVLTHGNFSDAKVEAANFRFPVARREADLASLTLQFARFVTSAL